MPAKIDWSPAQIEVLKDGNAHGLVLKELATKVGLSINSVARKLDELNLSRRNNQKLMMRLRTGSAETAFRKNKITLPRIAAMERIPSWYQPTARSS